MVFRKTKDLYLIITQKLIILKSVKSGRFHEIHEIWWISPWNPWNPVDFMKSGGFQVKSGRFHEIQQISGQIWQISGEIHPNLIKSDVSTKTLQFRGCMEGGYDPRFHEIQGHSPSPAFIKLNSFCWNIWFYKVLGGFHLKSAGFHVKSKDHLQGIVILCFNWWTSLFFASKTDYRYFGFVICTDWPVCLISEVCTFDEAY